MNATCPFISTLYFPCGDGARTLTGSEPNWVGVNGIPPPLLSKEVDGGGRGCGREGRGGDGTGNGAGASCDMHSTIGCFTDSHVMFNKIYFVIVPCTLKQTFRVQHAQAFVLPVWSETTPYFP